MIRIMALRTEISTVLILSPRPRSAVIRVIFSISSSTRYLAIYPEWIQLATRPKDCYLVCTLISDDVEYGKSVCGD